MTDAIVKSRSNNPAGRPPGERSLTQLLKMQLDQPVLYKGELVTGKALLAYMVTNSVLTGKIPFYQPPFNQLSIKEWIALATWVYQYVEPAATRITGADDGPVKIKVTLRNE